VYFPLSRGWAALLAAAGSADAFLATLPVNRLSRPLVHRVLAMAETRTAALVAADRQWESAFFGKGPALAEMEERRLAAARALMGLRSSLAPLHLTSAFPAVHFQVEPVPAVFGRHAHRLLHPDQAFAASLDPAAVQASRGFLTPRAVQGWVRWRSPLASAPAAAGLAGAGSDLAWAKVLAPLRRHRAASGRQPSVVFAHGIGMEPEFVGEVRRGFDALLRAGVRIIRIEAPWHGRRRLSGWYGGEPLLAHGPGGLLDFFHAHVIEIGQMVAWARATRGVPVAVAGVSLGALTAQMVAMAAHHWPAAMRPDALFLVSPSRSVVDAVFAGTLTRGLGVPEAITAAGWTAAELDPWRPLFEPTRTPAVDPQAIIIVLGDADTVTPTEQGEALAALWQVPQAQVFHAPAGHFTTAMSLAGNPPSIAKLVALLHR
jgi:pimeloyl-ACP methyl ester carboxylesterase